MYRYIHGKTDLLKPIYTLYHLHYISFSIKKIPYTISLIYRMLLWVITYLSITSLQCFLEEVQGYQVLLDILLYLSTRKRYHTFWRVRGVIDRFKNMRRKISSGVENTAYELMIDMHFRTTLKCDLPHY